MTCFVNKFELVIVENQLVLTYCGLCLKAVHVSKNLCIGKIEQHEFKAVSTIGIVCAVITLYYVNFPIHKKQFTILVTSNKQL